MNDKELMLRAIRLSEESVKSGGGPFGAVIARNGEVVAEASNCVTIDCDPTAHAEVSAIRKAAKAIGSFDLGAARYTLRVNRVRCVWVLYTGHISTRFSMPTTARTLLQ